jgi:ornithine carbamoyltransferase
MPHFLTLMDLSPQALDALIARAIVLKHKHQRGEMHDVLRNRVLGMLFEKSSTRTRVSFETAMAHCGGHAIFLSPRDTQLGRGETIEDMARVLSRMVDCIMVRTYAHSTLERFAAYSCVPVINGLTDFCHPCQLLADMMTYYEERGSIRGKTVAWIGDGNNMCHSYINAARQFGFHLRIATPKDYAPDAVLVAHAAPEVKIVTDPRDAAKDADLIVTDTWASMGQEEEHAQRIHAFQPFQVNQSLMDLARPDALFMHCLPAHRGEEVTDEVIDGPHSVVWQEAENRLHTQKALLELLILTPLTTA